jgi:GTP cyclohydrolase II
MSERSGECAAPACDKASSPTDRPCAVRVASCKLRNAWAEFDLHGFVETGTRREHIALTLGTVAGAAPALVRLHSECLTGDVLFSRRCDCGAQLESALRAIAREGRGALVYLRQEGRGIGLVNKIRAYHLQDHGADTVEANHLLGFAADPRDYGVAASILDDLGITAVRLLTNNPRKAQALESYGIAVIERVPLIVGWNEHNARYRRAKAARLGHLLHTDAPERSATAVCDRSPGGSRETLG